MYLEELKSWIGSKGVPIERSSEVGGIKGWISLLLSIIKINKKSLGLVVHVACCFEGQLILWLLEEDDSF